MFELNFLNRRSKSDAKVHFSSKMTPRYLDSLENLSSRPSNKIVEDFTESRASADLVKTTSLVLERLTSSAHFLQKFEILFASL